MRHVAARTAATLLLILTFSIQLALHGYAATTLGFYATSCPRAEAIVRQVVQSRFASDPTITAGLLRLFFHDCFANGCDASVLLDSTPGNLGEKDAGPNLTLRDFSVIDEIKRALEAACPATVSCSDTIAFAVRDSIVLAGGPSFPVGGGRLDSFTSRIADADVLPGPSSSVDEAVSAFASKGLSLDDMVTLLGAHTVGFAHCSFFSDRLFNFEGSGQPDPTMNPTLVSRLSGVCPNPPGSIDPSAALDQGTRDAFDSSYYSQLKQGNGILQIDQELTGDTRTSASVNQFTRQAQFFNAFTRSINILGNLNIKTTASQGEVRIECNKKNAKVPPVKRPPKVAPVKQPPKVPPQPKPPAAPRPKPPAPPTLPKPRRPQPTKPTRPRPRKPISKPRRRPPKPSRRPPPKKPSRRRPPPKKPSRKPSRKKPTKKPVKKPIRVVRH